MRISYCCIHYLDSSVLRAHVLRSGRWPCICGSGSRAESTGFLILNGWLGFGKCVTLRYLDVYRRDCYNTATQRTFYLRSLCTIVGNTSKHMQGHCQSITSCAFLAADLFEKRDPLFLTPAAPSHNLYNAAPILSSEGGLFLEPP